MITLHTEIKTWPYQHLRSGIRDLNTARLISDYSIETHFSEQAIFSISDIYSLALLLMRERLMHSESAAGRTYYPRAILALAITLGISDPWLLLNRLEGLPNRHGIDPIEQLFRYRLQIIRFQDEWGSLLEGDLWGTSVQQVTRAELLTSNGGHLKAARASYQSTSNSVLEQLRFVDSAISETLAWNDRPGVRFVDIPHYPSVSEFWENHRAP